MHITFICGSLEPGKDGVGDYSRRLAGEIIRQGHNASLIALYDRHCIEVEDTTQQDADIEISVLRLPKSVTKAERLGATKDFLTKQKPDVLSLQFVPYSFQDKGLPFWLPSFLKQLKFQGKWHIMFHELWAGMSVQDSLKLQCVGMVQKYLINDLIKQLNPSLIQTQNQLYLYYLKKLTENRVQILPLITNIPVLKKKEKKNDTYFTVTAFGTLYPSSFVYDFIIELQKITKHKNLQLRFLFVGGNGPLLEDWVRICKEKHILFEIKGRLEDVEISSLIQQSDIGVSTTPYALSEKSGAAAAFKHHGKPVIIVSRKWTPKNVSVELPKSIGFYDFATQGISESVFDLNTCIDLISNQEISSLFIKSLKDL